ncbi:AraC family transcriptional regulator [Vibrio sp. ZSDZ34]|uniref:AraC family transcriptional regulator n=1 Tax=Vibrio gelatinilyticus TaxID=2893468 RepID=A0A9X1WE91_9VIBR|nr:AraC family transcriptional regulator [Vibrio gelatinilyticus]MCJ2377603.1 AraC family transcriptional regulator [Vibrio gelatinilyticus]
MSEHSKDPLPAQIVQLPAYMSSHDHQYSQVVVGLKGQAEFEVGGVGNLVGPGQGCVVTAGLDHAFGGTVDEPDILVLNLPIPNDNDPLVLNRINELSQGDIYFQLDSQIQKLIRMLVQEMTANPDDLLLSRACNDTVVALLQRHILSFKGNHRESRFDLAQIDRYIDQHLSRGITVSQLAGSVFLGESQFYALFKEQLGITPHQYVLGKRIDAAKTLIEQGRLSLGQVAELTGFSGQSTFSHAFARLQGISPSQYKRRFR